MQEATHLKRQRWRLAQLYCDLKPCPTALAFSPHLSFCVTSSDLNAASHAPVAHTETLEALGFGSESGLAFAQQGTADCDSDIVRFGYPAIFGFGGTVSGEAPLNCFDRRISRAPAGR
jgi:hypothetical protein